MCSLHCSCTVFRGHCVIRVEKHHPWCGHFGEAAVACGASAYGTFIQKFDAKAVYAIVLSHPFMHHGLAGIRRGVVHQYHIQWTQSLCGDAVEGTAYEFGTVVYRDNNRKLRADGIIDDTACEYCCFFRCLGHNGLIL